MDNQFILLTPSQRNEVANKIQDQLDEIYGVAKELSIEEQQRVDEIEKIFSDFYSSPDQQTAEKEDELMQLNDELSNIYGLKLDSELTPEQLEQVEDLHSQLAELSACEDRLSPEMQALYDQLDDIFGLPKNLYKEETEKVDYLNSQLEKSISDRDDSKTDIELKDEISDITGIRSFEQLSSTEQEKVHELQAKIAELAPAEAQRLNGPEFADIEYDSSQPDLIVYDFEVIGFDDFSFMINEDIQTLDMNAMGEYTNMPSYSEDFVNTLPQEETTDFVGVQNATDFL